MSILKQCGQEATLLVEYDVSIMGESRGRAGGERGERAGGESRGREGGESRGREEGER